MLMIVDDEPDILTILKEYFEDKLEIVMVSETFNDAKTIMQTLVFDVVIVDYKLSENSGLELIKEIRENPNFKNCKCIVFSAYNEAATKRAKDENIHVDFFLDKPSSLPDIKSALELVLSKS